MPDSRKRWMASRVSQARKSQPSIFLQQGSLACSRSSEDLSTLGLSESGAEALFTAMETITDFSGYLEELSDQLEFFLSTLLICPQAEALRASLDSLKALVDSEAGAWAANDFSTAYTILLQERELVTRGEDRQCSLFFPGTTAFGNKRMAECVKALAKDETNNIERKVAPFAVKFLKKDLRQIDALLEIGP